MSNPNQLFLLADHIKLSLLERQRAQSLDLDEDDSKDGHISRSFDHFREGLTSLRQERDRLEQEGDETAAASLSDSIPALQKQLDALTSQFHGFSDPSTDATVTQPNSNSEELSSDFARAASTSAAAAAEAAASGRKSKTVRFSDTPQSPSADPADELFGRYRDDPGDSAGYTDQAAGLDNQQLHQYHSQILNEQDEQLDRLGDSIGRQRDLSMQIGDELDNHVAMLDEVDGATDRHQSRLDRARRTLGRVAKGAGENKQMTAIVVLIIILVLLIAILK